LRPSHCLHCNSTASFRPRKCPREHTAEAAAVLQPCPRGRTALRCNSGSSFARLCSNPTPQPCSASVTKEKS
jgi:hypothetical protein